MTNRKFPDITRKSAISQGSKKKDPPRKWLQPNPSISELAKKIIDEAYFIGMVSEDTREIYLKLASANRINLDAVKEILRIEKAALINEYEQSIREGTIDQLELENRDRYRLLFRAKYLTEPKTT